jgi:hypothetical protein
MLVDVLRLRNDDLYAACQQVADAVFNRRRRYEGSLRARGALNQQAG